MNSSAKMTAVTLLAVAALGAAVATQGCTITSGTDSDTDGGATSSSGSSGQSSGGTADGGSAPKACVGNKQAENNGFAPESCQTCLEQKCCTQLKTCFDIAADEAGTTLDCNAYVECTDECQKKPAADIADCQQACDDNAAAGVVKAYDAIPECGKASCAKECGFEGADGG